MQKTKILLIAVFGILLAACGGDSGSAKDAAKSAADTAEKAMGAATEAAGKAMDAASDAADKAMEAASTAGEAVKVSAGNAVSYVDHSKDEMEFQLKQSIDGWKSLLEDVSDSEEVTKIKEHIAAMEEKLGNL